MADAVRAGLDDPHRIEAARRLLAEARGEALDRLAALSARLLSAGHAQIVLIAERPTVISATAPGDLTVGALTLRAFEHGEPLASQDGVAAFLGVPIDVDGTRVGVLSVSDAEPHEWSRHDVETLCELAGTVASELERGALTAELEDSSVRLDLGFAAAAIGSFDWNLTTDALHFDERLLELFGYTEDDWVPHIDSFAVRLHPDDRVKTEAAITSAIEARGDYEADYRVVHPDGSVRWIAARGRVLADPDGRPVRMLGAAYDTTEVHSAAERLGRVLETMSTAFFTLGRDWRFTYVNAAAERLMGRGRNDLVGHVIWEAYDDLEGTPSAINYRAAMETGQPRSFEHFYPPLDAHFDVRATPSDDGISVYFHDITSRVRAEQEREAALEQTGAATGRLQILSAASARLAGTLDVDELLRILGDVVLNGFGEGPGGGARLQRRVPGRHRGPPAGGARRAPADARGRGARGRPLRHAHRRAGRARRRAGGARARARDGAAADLARAHARRGGRDRRGRERARPARAGRARGARRRRARQRGAVRLRAPARAHPAALAAADGAAGAAGDRARRALSAGHRRAGRRRRLLPRPSARRRPPAADDRRRHGPRPPGRGADGPAARGADRLRVRRRPARSRPRARLHPRHRAAGPADGDRDGRDLRPRVAPADVRARRAICRRWSRRSTGSRRTSAPSPARRWARASPTTSATWSTCRRARRSCSTRTG